MLGATPTRAIYDTATQSSARTDATNSRLGAAGIRTNDDVNSIYSNAVWIGTRVLAIAFTIVPSLTSTAVTRRVGEGTKNEKPRACASRAKLSLCVSIVWPALAAEHAALRDLSQISITTLRRHERPFAQFYSQVSTDGGAPHIP